MITCGLCRKKEASRKLEWLSGYKLYSLCGDCAVTFELYADRYLAQPSAVETDPDTVYLVSGFQRSGTSATMRALWAGGMPVMDRAERMQTVNRVSDKDYKLNPELFELTQEDYQQPDFPDQFRGMCIKGLQQCIARCKPQVRIKMIFMRRDYHEISQSYQAGFERGPSPEKVEKVVESALVAALNRRDTEFIEVWYRDMIRDAEQGSTEQLGRMKELFDLPLDITAMARIIDPKLCRFKKEELDLEINATGNKRITDTEIASAFGE